MCQTCGCLANLVVDELVHEHAAMGRLIRLAGGQMIAGRRNEVAATCRAISAVLEVHTAVEEEGLFAELFRDFPGPLDALTREHRDIERVLDEAAGGTPHDPLWPERLRDALGALREHIRREQEGVFPAAIISLDAEQWASVEAVRRRVGSPLEGRVRAS